MQSSLYALGALLLLSTASAAANDTDDLIALDKQWGASATKGDLSLSEKMLGEQLVSVTPEGVRGKQAELADIKATASDATYQPTDYKVSFINPDTAIMTHSTKGTDAHHSLHVFVRKGGKWQIVATSTTPAKGGT